MRRAFRVQPERRLQGEAHESLGRAHVRRVWRDSALDGLGFDEQIETRSSLQDVRRGEPDASLLAVPSGDKVTVEVKLRPFQKYVCLACTQ